jgi:CheY-like chemotaxis protein
MIPIRIQVEDTGIGIASEALDRLFQPFSQVDGSTTRRFGGKGLGLSIAAQLIALMDGKIGVHSTPGAGSSFWFLLPFKPGQAALPEEAPGEGVRRDISAPTQKRQEKILLVDDNQINVLVARKQLAQLGFEIAEVYNGREALDALKRERFDLVFMDCHMPEMNGFEATAEIRKNQTVGSVRIPIIAMTADARQEDRQRCLVAGMDDYVSKPTSLKQLQTVIDRWIPDTSEMHAKIA